MDGEKVCDVVGDVGEFVCCGVIVGCEEGGWGEKLGEMMQKGSKISNAPSVSR